MVSYSYPPVLGGSEIEAQRVCAALIRRGYRVTVLCAGGSPMPDTARWTDPYGVPVRIFGRRVSGRAREIVFALAVAWTLFRERRDYDLVYFLMQGLHLATALPICRALRKPLVMKVSGSSLITLMRQSWIGRLELRWLNRWARRIMILNEGMAEEASAAGIAKRLLLWMPNPVDTDEFAPCSSAVRQEQRAALRLPVDAFCIVFVGRLAPEKQLGSLLKAMPRIVECVSNALLIVVGEGPSRPELEELTAKLRIAGHVRFAGRQTVPQVRDWLQSSDVFTLVSSNEGFPCSLAEAMSVGLPSVVSNIPANRQLIDPGVQGLLSETGDAESISMAVVELSRDPASRNRMGEAARDRIVRNYSLEKVVSRYETLFDEALCPK